MSPEQTYFALLAIGIVLLLLEIFLPGGVLGLVGVVLLLAATYQGFELFGPTGGALGVVVTLAVLIAGAAGWIRLFPHTWFGKQMILSTELDEEEDAEGSLVGEHGIALTDIQPSGLARIRGKRCDVIAQSGWIPKGSHVEVVAQEAFQIYVIPVSSEEPVAAFPDEAPA